MSSPVKQKTPNHVAIIMDGNSRWARDRNLPTSAGHQAGADRLKDILEVCSAEQIQVLTVFAFSSENWNRPKQEVGALMSLFTSSLKRYKRQLLEQNISLRVIGRRDRFSDRLVSHIESVERETAGGKATLVIAADYGGQWDIADTARRLAERVKRGELEPDQIDESLFSQAVHLGDLPPTDLLIRTGAESRVSNFLLWQIAYSELFFANCYWPDFDQAWFRKALNIYAQADRRYGGRNETDTSSPLNANAS